MRAQPVRRPVHARAADRPSRSANTRRPTSTIVFVVVLALVLTACAAGPNPEVGSAPSGAEPAGFWLGLWHGVIAPVTFVVSLFSDEVSLYEVHNSGNWYDLGFFLGFGVLLGGGAGGSSRRR